MKLSEILKNLNGEEFPYSGDDTFLEECRGDCFGWADLSEHGFTYQPIVIWYCTDRWVGVNAIYHNGELICITEQDGRRCPVEIKWVSREIFQKTSTFVQSLFEEEDDYKKYIDLDEEYDLTYKIEFTGQLIDRFHSEAIFNGNKVKIEWELTNREERNNYICKKVWIVDGNVTKCVNVNDLLFPIKIKEQ